MISGFEAKEKILERWDNGYIKKHSINVTELVTDYLDSKIKREIYHRDLGSSSITINHTYDDNELFMFFNNVKESFVDDLFTLKFIESNRGN